MKNRTWIYSLVLLLATAGLLPAASPAPKLVVENARHDVGRVLSGTVIKHTFKLKNAGTSPLILTNVIPSCGCTAIQDWAREIPPGGEGSIPLEFNSTGMLGQIQKSVGIYSNDPAEPLVSLLLVGLIWQPLELHPGVAFIQMPPGTRQTLSTTIRIVNQTENPLKLQPPVSSLPEFSPRIQEVTPGKEFHLIIDVKPPAVHADLTGSITLKTSSAESPEITVPVVVIAQPEIMVSPPQMFLPAVPPDPPQSYIISVRNQGPAPITLDRAACDAPDSTVNIREITKGQDFELVVNFAKDFAYIPDKSFAITVHTSNPNKPLINIPVLFAKPLLPAPPAPTRGR